MKKMVCFYAVAAHLGGSERSLLEIVRGIAERPERGYFPWVILPKEGALSEKLKEAGVEYTCLPMPEAIFEMSRNAPLESLQHGLFALPKMSLYLAKLSRLIRERKPVLIHTNAIKCHAIGAWVGPALGVPVLWHLRDILPKGPTLWSLQLMRKVPGIHVVANSAATADAFSARDRSIHVVYNGLKASDYLPNRNRAFNRELGVSDDVPIVGILGVLARWKGQMEFLQMAQRLIQDGSPARFVVVGAEIYDTVSDRGFGSELKEEARKMGIADRVLFTGFRPDPALAINGLDVLVHASKKPEPFGRVLIEAMACGVPVVASADGGVLEIADDGKNALLVQPGDPLAMAEAVSKLLSDAELRTRLVEKGRANFLSRFTSDKYVEGVLRLYDSITRR